MIARAHTLNSPLRLAVDGRVLDDRYHGIGRITEALLRQWAGRRDVDVTVFVRGTQQSVRFDLAALIEGSGFRRAAFDASLTSPAQWWRWPKALRRAGVEAALFPYHLGAAVAGPCRRYAFVHDCIFETDRSFAPDARTRFLYTSLTRVVIRRSHVLTPSRASADEIARRYGVSVGDSAVVRWGVDASFEVAARTATVDGLTMPTTYHLHVGARRPHKNVVTLIEALALLPASDSLVLVGTVDSRWPDPVTDAARRLGVVDRILHIPNVSEEGLRAAYAGARTFLYPSVVEGFGLPLLEAMAAGVPVVASDIPVFREVAGDAAEFVAPRDPIAWAAAVVDLRDGRRRTAAIERGRAHVAHATWEAAGERALAAMA